MPIGSKYHCFDPGGEEGGHEAAAGRLRGAGDEGPHPCVAGRRRPLAVYFNKINCV